jgi:glycerol-3-phosphate dehydrogenase
VSGLITVAGGKYTTYRVMAKDVVDVAARAFDRKIPPCCTDEIPLVGAPGYRAEWNRRELLAEGAGLHVHVLEHLLARYGARTGELLELIAADPRLGEPVDGAPTYLAAELHYAASHEGALHLDDVLTRRTRISIETFDRGRIAAREAARILGGILGWDAATQAREIEHYDARVEAERESQTQPDDRTADAARLGAPDVRMGGLQAGGDPEAQMWSDSGSQLSRVAKR